jgi:hypothetical protein
MTNHNELFKDSDIEGSVQANTEVIKSAIEDHTLALQFLTTQQGAGKTTSEKEVFESMANVILLAQSNERVKELAEEISEDSPDCQFKTIYSLEGSCTTYIENIGTLEPRVNFYRSMGILPQTIHQLMCPDPYCVYLDQDRTISGRIITTLDMFMHLKDQIGTNQKFLILLDEGDGLLNMNKKVLPPELFNQYAHKEVYEGNDYLPHISKWDVPNIRDPNEDILELCREGKFSNSIPGLKAQLANMTFTEGVIDVKKIQENSGYIRLLKTLIDIFANKYFSYYQNNRKMKIEIYLTPSILELSRFILTHPRITMIVASASLRHHRLRWRKVIDYFELARMMLMSEISQTISDFSGYKLERQLQVYDYIQDCKTPQEFRSPFIAKKTKLIVKSDDTHSFSKKHYSILDEENSAESKRIIVEDELISYIKTLVPLYEKIEGKQVNKILLITFEEGVKTIEEERKNLYKKIVQYNKKYGKDEETRNLYELLKKIDAKTWFSSKWHGINANKTHDLVLLIGDPIENEISEFLRKKNAGKATIKGFTIKEDCFLSEWERDMANESILTELLEGIHRSRGDLDVIYVGNLLNPDNINDKLTRMKVIVNDGMELQTFSEWFKDYNSRYVSPIQLKPPEAKMDFNQMVEKVYIFIVKKYNENKSPVRRGLISSNFNWLRGESQILDQIIEFLTRTSRITAKLRKEGTNQWFEYSPLIQNSL